MGVLSALEPAKVFQFFEEICPFLTVPEMWSRSAIIWWICERKRIKISPGREI